MNQQRPPPLTVSQLTNAIKLSLESTFSFVYLQGEISNFKMQSSGHLYFSVKDAHAQIAAVMFRAEASLLKKPPKSGDQVIIKGDLNVYPPKGNYQLIVRELSYVGIGELLQKLELLKVKLLQMGWFKSIHKKPLPRFPRRIGVITSPTGAVIQDILNILGRRFSGFHLILNPVKVQGDGAAQEIAQAIEQFNLHDLVDVIIVGRGGGSLEDLWAFNEEIVASAIFHSRIPIISAVGHETDHCIADYVADVRAPTPSAAAEIVIAEKNQQLEYLQVIGKRISQALSHLIQKNKYRLLTIAKHSVLSHPHSILEWRMQQLDDYRIDLEHSIGQFLQGKKHQLEMKAQQAFSLKPINQVLYFKQKLNDRRQRLDDLWKTQQLKWKRAFQPDLLSQELYRLLNNKLNVYRQQLNYIVNMLKALDPKKVLEKGYSILFAEKSNSVINSVRKVKNGQQARLLLSDGEVLITINEVVTRKNGHLSGTTPPIHSP